ncbi:MAG: PepSY domain-containing protein [Acidimicrobiia bacterium]|jgi:hypothetical protein|nr:PepSY domain-containing protein [Acidimicrobiia bacterium]
MNKRTIGATLAGALLVTGLAGGAVAVAGGDQEGSAPGPDADRAVAAALAETGGGEANAVERDSENGAVWEVEVTKADGSTVDVRLDGDLHVIVVEPDVEDAGGH